MAAEALKKEGAKKILGCCTHPVLSGPAIKRIEECPLEELIVTNTIPLGPQAQGCGKIKTLSVAHLIGEAIRRTHEEESISSSIRLARGGRFPWKLLKYMPMRARSNANAMPNDCFAQRKNSGHSLRPENAVR